MPIVLGASPVPARASPEPAPEQVLISLIEPARARGAEVGWLGLARVSTKLSLG